MITITDTNEYKFCTRNINRDILWKVYGLLLSCFLRVGVFQNKWIPRAMEAHVFFVKLNIFLFPTTIFAKIVLKKEFNNSMLLLHECSPVVYRL